MWQGFTLLWSNDCYYYDLWCVTALHIRLQTISKLYIFYSGSTINLTIHETPLLKCFYPPAGLNLPTNKEKLIIIMCFLLKAGSHFTTNTWPWPCLPQLNLKGFIPNHCITILEEKKSLVPYILPQECNRFLKLYSNFNSYSQ